MKFTNAITKSFDKSEILFSAQSMKSKITLDNIDNLLAKNAGRFCEKNPGDIFKIRQKLYDWFRHKTSSARSTMIIVAIDKNHIRDMGEMHDTYKRREVPTYRKILAINISEFPARPGLGPDPTVTYCVKDITDEYCKLSVTAD